jgi:hypothetical protein
MKIDNFFSELKRRNVYNAYTIPFPGRAHARGRNFHGPFYGLKIFGRKTAQFCVTRRKPGLLDSPMKNTLRNAVKRCAIR